MKQNHILKVTDEQLIAEFAITPHIGKIASKFELPHVTIWRRLKKLGLKSTSIGGKGKIPLSEILEGFHPYYQTYKLSKRLLKENILKNECSVCRLDSWLNKPLVLELDHIDGDSSNHKLDNLRFICPNCHSQTDTYCGKNKI